MPSYRYIECGLPDALAFEAVEGGAGDAADREPDIADFLSSIRHDVRALGPIETLDEYAAAHGPLLGGCHPAGIPVGCGGLGGLASGEVESRALWRHHILTMRDIVALDVLGRRGTLNHGVLGLWVACSNTVSLEGSLLYHGSDGAGLAYALDESLDLGAAASSALERRKWPWRATVPLGGGSDVDGVLGALSRYGEELSERYLEAYLSREGAPEGTQLAALQGQLSAKLKWMSVCAVCGRVFMMKRRGVSARFHANICSVILNRSRSEVVEAVERRYRVGKGMALAAIGGGKGGE